MNRCPNCKAQYRGKESCHRCGMGLQHLLRIERQAQHQIKRSVTALQQQRLDEASDALQKAQRLKGDPLNTRLIQFVAAQAAASAPDIAKLKHDRLPEMSEEGEEGVKPAFLALID
jgi:hypothetical protein